MKIRTKSPVIEGMELTVQEESKLKEPLKFSSEALDKLAIDLMGYPFIAIGNALLCPKCGVQQGVLTNRAPDGEVNFYLNFRCDDYKELELAKIKELGDLAEASQEPQSDVSEESQQQ